MTIDSAYVLVFHGSRDVRAQKASQGLTKLVRTSLETTISMSPKNKGGILLLSKPPLVEAAYLELAEISLSESIYQLGLTAIAEGIEKINIIPMLLATGVHVQIDIPTAVAEAQNQLGAKINLNICSHLGSYPEIVNLVQRQYQNLPQQGRILLAHGSRLNAANQEVERLAQAVDAVAAYSFIPPSLEMQVQGLVQQGKKIITIVPYVLFPGKITEAIATQIEQLESQFAVGLPRRSPALGNADQETEIIFSLGQPLGVIPDLAYLIRNILHTL